MTLASLFTPEEMERIALFRDRRLPKTEKDRVRSTRLSDDIRSLIMRCHKHSTAQEVQQLFSVHASSVARMWLSGGLTSLEAAQKARASLMKADRPRVLRWSISEIELTPKAKAAIDAKRGECRYPAGAGDEFRFCGEPTVANPDGRPSSYCSHCIGLVYSRSYMQRLRQAVSL